MSYIYDTITRHRTPAIRARVADTWECPSCGADQPGRDIERPCSECGALPPRRRPGEVQS